MTEKPEVFTVHSNQWGDAEVDHVDLTELQKEVTDINYSLAATVEQNKQELFKIKGVLGPDGNYLDVGHLIFQLQDQVKALTEQVKTMQESTSSTLQTQEEYNEMIKQNQSTIKQLGDNQGSIETTQYSIQTKLEKHGIS
jgi:hypothetical protein